MGPIHPEPSHTLVAFTLLSLVVPCVLAAAAPAPPVARKEPRPTTLHGDTRPDDYHWLREKTDPKVLAYLAAENAYSDSMTAGLAPLADSLYAEFLARIRQTDLSAPYKKGAYFYYTRTEEGKQYPYWCRKKGALDAPEELMLDGNAMAVGHRFFAIGDFAVSPDGSRLAYDVDTTGYRQ